MYPLPTPTIQEFTRKQTAYTFEQVCNTIAKINTAYALLCSANGQFEEVFKSRYFSHIGIYFVTDKSKIDSEYTRLHALREQVERLDEPALGNGIGYNRSGGAQECYPVAKWQTQIAKYMRAAAKLTKALG